MEVFMVLTVVDVTEGILTITSYAYCYFDIPNIKPMEFWSKMFDLHKENTSWKAVLLVVELCFCVPILNATVGSLFNYTNMVKTAVRNRLLNDSLNFVLQICVSGISMKTFHNVYVDKCGQYCYNTKNCCLQQKKINLKPTKKGEKNKNTTF